MPIPRPQQDEDQSKFMSRCISFMHGENEKKQEGDKWSKDQMAAICFSQWKKRGAEADITLYEKESDEEFIERFLKKYPQYATYFEDKEPVGDLEQEDEEVN